MKTNERACRNTHSKHELERLCTNHEAMADATIEILKQMLEEGLITGVLLAAAKDASDRAVKKLCPAFSTRSLVPRTLGSEPAGAGKGLCSRLGSGWR